jgi:PAS domain S-box-containing protein
MSLHSADGHVEPTRDRGVVRAGGHLGEYFPFAAGQVTQRAAVRTAARRQHRLDDLRIDHRSTRSNRTDRISQLTGLGDPLLEQVRPSRDAVLQQRDGMTRLVVLAQHHHPGRRMAAPNVDRGADAFVGICRRHADIGDHDVRSQVRDRRQQLVVIGRQTDDHDVALVVEKCPNALTDKQIVVRDHRSEAHEFVPYAGGRLTIGEDVNDQAHHLPPRGAADSVRVIDPGLLLRLEHQVADILAGQEAEDLIFVELLQGIGTALRWPVGAVWQARASSELHCAASWSAPEFDGAPFVAESRSAALASGVGLPGRVWRSGEPAWIADVADDENFPRAAAAARAGLHAAFCFPLRSGDGIEGLAEFYSPHRMDPSRELLATMASLGSRIGDALRRQRVDHAVRLSEARLRAVLAAALDAVVIADAGGVVLEFNPAACATFGYPRDQAVGRQLAELIIPPDLRERHRQGLAHYLHTEKPSMLDRRIEISGMRADGSVFPVELTITRIAVAGSPVFAGYVRDLSERHRAQEELRASRHRLAEAAMAERQRLEHDLHDGAQQRLIALGAALNRARTALPNEPARAAEILDGALASLDEAAIELRNLARGIHPSSLTRHGLAAALADIARRSPVELSMGTLPTSRFPASVEATAYFVVSEALTNVARHAGTNRARVTLTITDLVTGEPALEVMVADDGAGGASVTNGTGLQGLADRVAFLDGAFDVVSPEGGGTRVRARIPLG